MAISLPKHSLKSYISSQVNTFFPDDKLVNLNEYDGLVDIAIDRVDYCFRSVAHNRYNKDGKTILNHLYADQYLVFIWFLSNTLWREKKDPSIANKLYYLNRALHSFDCMYDTGLPDVFLVFHGAGTMLG